MLNARLGNNITYGQSHLIPTEISPDSSVPVRIYDNTPGMRNY